jgi:hypothetical protein
MFQTWGDALSSAYIGIGPVFVSLGIRLLVSIVIFVAGWIAGTLIGKIIEKVFQTIKFDRVMSQIGLEQALKRGGYTLNSGAFIGGMAKWFVIILFVIAVFDVLGLSSVTGFMQAIAVQYVPQVIIAVLILLVSTVLAEVLQKAVVAAAAGAHVKHAQGLGRLTKWAIIIFAGLAALDQLGIATSIVQTISLGIAIACGLGFGLSFGLGGKEAASEIIASLRKDFRGDSYSNTDHHNS